MSSTRQSNTDRRLGREECRKKLSEHIHSRLGIKIIPANVRLNPRTNDPYMWRVLPGKEEFFAKVFFKKLSDHSISTYRLLCKEFGKTFEAVEPSPQCVTQKHISSVAPEPSFRTMIDNLKKRMRDFIKKFTN
ncbi:hypothetical protein B0T26DRAFT_824787 [Lasiosphaeria miniovina]|uniref:Uncharacterized protein n=1 Tax=Lasiosphaeria miniovina TaxID=1954250 RepID=A0AA40E2G4_9PEZI|nr:uncharacterized protein B0T26DRAFT_824787 [Lasiosphaeria miniovina]KAK0721746.1 hypothetical protein B0T26DRAFT_824787 [Lasiosphaeria miniovina]